MSSPYQDFLADILQEVLERVAPVDGIFMDMCWDQPSCSKWAIDGMLKKGFDPQKEEDRNRYAREVAHQYMQRYRDMVEEAQQKYKSASCQAKVGDRPVFDFSVKAGSTEISNFGGGNAEISIPYTPNAVILNPTSTAVIIDNVVINGSVKLNYTVSGFKGSTGSIDINDSPDDTTVGTFNTLDMPAYSWASVFIPNLAGAPTAAMTESNLDTAAVNLTLTSSDTFKDNTLDASNFTLNDAPAGTTVEAVIYTDATHANVLLAFNGTDFDEDVITFAITVAGAELAKLCEKNN